MCTINSLDYGFFSSSFFSSLRTVLVFALFILNQDSSGARNHCASAMPIIVMAPADITVNIRRNTICDTIINLPAATFTGQCSGPLSFTTYSVFNFLNTSGGSMYFTSGIFKVFYTVSDDCGMVGIDSMLVHVYDASLPNVICTPQQTMNLPSYGYLDAPAWIFDAGSSDSCGHVYFKVKRMFPTSGYDCSNPGNPNNAFDDQIRFCCLDLDSSAIMVILRVYDLDPGPGPVSDDHMKARSVDCMIEALVKDKIAPDLDCPNNVTVSCGADIDSVFLASSVPVISDNCGIISFETFDTKNLDACGAGTFTRTYVATDLQGQVSSCSQTITVLKVNTFDGLDVNQLKWPDHKVVFACRIDPDTIQAGVPEIKEDACANVLISKRDEKYNFDRGGVCSKILRYWEVIDWCKYNPRLSPNPKTSSNGYYSYVQEIKIMDTVAPVLSGIRDTVIGIQTPGCQPGFIQLPGVSANDCGSSSNISISYQVDYYTDGQIDLQNDGANASGLFPIGKHRLIFYAKDSCHNAGSLIINLEVFDAKPPTANAIFGLASSLTQMQSGAMISIHARLFNAKSTDNCTKESDLRFSFSSDINDTIRVFNCDSLGLRIIHLFVWDQQGNSNTVQTFITITDVNNLCPSAIPGVLFSGQLLTGSKEVIKDAFVRLSYDNIQRNTISDNDGNFSFDGIPRNKKLILSSSSNKQFADGITTADIIKIQRHILGLEMFTSPFDLFAADVDLNKRITTKDITWLRKLILGQITEIPNQDSYIFIDKTYPFTVPLNPFDELDSSRLIQFEIKDDNFHLEILGIKLGDVNYSFKANGFQINKATNSTLQYSIFNNQLIIYPDFNKRIDGFQFELVNQSLCANPWVNIQSNLENWSDANYKVDGNKLRVSYSGNKTFLSDYLYPFIQIPLGEIQENCTPYLKLSTDFPNEIYVKSEVLNINSIESVFVHTPQVDADHIKIFPNPFNEQLNLLFTLTNETVYQLEIFSTDQRIVYSQKYKLSKSENTVLINKQILPGKGMYFLHLQNDKTSRVFKIVNE